MNADTRIVSPAQRWAGRIISGLVVALLLLDAVIKLPPLQPVLDTMQQLGFVSTPALARSLGVLLIACTMLYAIPRTAVLGAVLLTGYLGGAIATHLRADSPLFTHILFGSYVGIAMWVGLLLRDPSARAFLFGTVPSR